MTRLESVHDPTRADAAIPEQLFALELPGRGPVVGRAWNARPDRTTVGIVHGLGDHAGRYGRAVDALVRHGFAVEAIDLPGHGRSYGARGHASRWSEYRDAMDAWWARPRDGGAPPAALLGHSMGALAVLDFALQRPGRVRALVLSAPPFDVVLRASMLKVKLAQLIVRVWPGFSQRTTILPSMLSRDPDVVRAHNVDPLVHYTMSARLFFEFNATNRALRDAARRLTVPTLVLHGTGDIISSSKGSERWAALAPPGLATLRLYPGLFHEILSEREGPAIAEEIAIWLKLALG